MLPLPAWTHARHVFRRPPDRRRLLGALAAAALAAAGCRPADPAPAPAAKTTPLLCCVGGTMRPPMEELVTLYQERTGQPIELDFGDSGQLMIKIQTTRRGDLYVCHDPFGGGAQKAGLAADVWTIAAIRPVIVVAKGNQKAIKGLRDLAKPGLRLIFTDWQYSTVGHIDRIMLGYSGVGEAVERNVVSLVRGGGEAANAVALGTADAAIVWDAVAFLRRDKLDTVDIEPEYRPRRDVDAVTSATHGRIDMDYVRVTLSVLAGSTQPQAARAFAAFVTSPEGQAVFGRYGFAPPDPARPAPWETGAPQAALAGSILVHCGAGLRLPVEELAQAFTRQTGVRVDVSFAGSNVLLSQLEVSRKGDVLIPGDDFYLAEATKRGLVGGASPLCRFSPVILVAKGNPKGIRTLADLARPGLRLGLGDAQACAVGRLLPELLAKAGLPAAALDANRSLNAMTVSELALAVELGSADAALVWDAVAASVVDSTEAVAIPAARNVTVDAAGAVCSGSTNPGAAQAFLAHLASPDGQAVFRRHGFGVGPPP